MHEYPTQRFRALDGYDRFNAGDIYNLTKACGDAVRMRNANEDFPLHAAFRLGEVPPLSRRDMHV